MQPAWRAGTKDGLIASYHFSVQIIGRSDGRSVVAAAAYRAGERLRDDRHGTVADYSRRRGVVHSEILQPKGSAAWLADRERLWNSVEAMEMRADAQLAREINLALPHELSQHQQLDLLRGFVQEQFVAEGMVADIAIHHPVEERGDDPRNVHAHILLTLRQATAAGLRAVKTRAWNSDGYLTSWRRAWAEHQNRSLRRFSPSAEPVDHRSLADQRQSAHERGDRASQILLDRLPELHIGARCVHAERQRRRPRGDDRAEHLNQPRQPPGVPEASRLSTRRSRADCRARAGHHPTRDVGLRLEANRRRVAANIQRYETSMRHWKRRAACLRALQHRVASVCPFSAPTPGAGAIGHHRRGNQPKAGDPLSELIATAARRRRRRLSLLHKLITLIESIIVALAHGRGRQRRREAALLGNVIRSTRPGPMMPNRRRRRRKRP